MSEPLDFDRYADPNYYYGYDSKAYRDLLAIYNATTDDQGSPQGARRHPEASSPPTRSTPTSSSCRRFAVAKKGLKRAVEQLAGVRERPGRAGLAMS